MPSARKVVGGVIVDQALLEALEPRRLLSGDHPGLDEFPDATFVPLEQMTEDDWAAELPGMHEAPGDADVFSFVAPVTSLQWTATAGTQSQTLSMSVRVMDGEQETLAARQLSLGRIAVAVGDEPLYEGQRYYVVVGGSSEATGDYRLIVTLKRAENPPEMPPPPDPVPLQWPESEGEVEAHGFLFGPALSDAYRLTLPDPGEYEVRIATYEDALDPVLTVRDDLNRVVLRDSTREQILLRRFTVAEGDSTLTFFVAPSDLELIGGHHPYRITIRYVGAPPAPPPPPPPVEPPGAGLVLDPSLSFALYHPEGFASPSIDEFVPLVNPNDYPVRYALVARYETGARDELVAEGVLAPHSRGGVTITSRRNPGASLVRQGVPYALEVRSDGPLGATLSHYDFGVTTGENFTDRVATTWTFGQLRRDPVNHRDFLVFYNPNDEAAEVEVTLYYQDGAVTTFTRSVGALRRSGINFTTDTAVARDGAFAVRLEASRPMVAAATSFDITLGRGFGELGEAGDGAPTGVVPGLDIAQGVESGLAFLNAQADSVTVELVLADATGAAVPLSFVLPGRSQRTLVLDDLAPAGVYTARYAASGSVSVSGFAYRDGDGHAAPAATAGATDVLFADAFINPAGAGVAYSERLDLFNPTGSAAEVEVILLFTDGTTAERRLSVEGGGSLRVQVHELPEILSLPGPTAFSIRVVSSQPLVSAFTHYDLFLGGGWRTEGAPLGTGTPLTLLM